MTHDERIATLQKWGYPERQAAFLAHVLVHGGCFIRRQFVAFQERPDGGAVTDFLRRLVDRGHARRRVFGRRTAVYEVRDRAMYAAVGLPKADTRRAVPAALVRQLMTLDVVLSLGDRRILATEAEKYAYFASERRVSARAFPATWYPGRRPLEPGVLRCFVDRVPVVIDPAEDRVSLLCDEFFVTQPGTCVDHVGLRFHAVRHRYACFGTSIAHDVYASLGATSRGFSGTTLRSSPPPSPPPTSRV